MVSDAQGIVEIMVQRGIKHDVVTYNSLIDGYCLQKNINQTNKVFDLMTSK